MLIPYSMFSEDEKYEARTRMADLEHLGERSSNSGFEDAELFEHRKQIRKRCQHQYMEY